MNELQMILTDWMGSVVDYLPIGYAFGAGMMSSVNPCGFAMLPVYLALYVGAQGDAYYERSVWVRGLKALLVAAVVTAGFVVLFGVIGAVISAGGRILITAMPWIALAIGLALVLLGFWMLAGGRLSAGFAARLAARIGDPREVSLRGFFLFGIAFAAASLSCTLPIFLVVVGGAVASSSFTSSVLQFFSYSLGMGLVILVLTLGMALFKEGLVIGRMRRLMPYVQSASAVVLILGGAYIEYYWLFKAGLIHSFI